MKMALVADMMLNYNSLTQADLKTCVMTWRRVEINAGESWRDIPGIPSAYPHSRILGAEDGYSHGDQKRK